MNIFNNNRIIFNDCLEFYILWLYLTICLVVNFWCFLTFPSIKNTVMGMPMHICCIVSNDLFKVNSSTWNF